MTHDPSSEVVPTSPIDPLDSDILARMATAVFRELTSPIEVPSPAGLHAAPAPIGERGVEALSSEPHDVPSPELARLQVPPARPVDDEELLRMLAALPASLAAGVAPPSGPPGLPHAAPSSPPTIAELAQLAAAPSPVRPPAAPATPAGLAAPLRAGVPSLLETARPLHEAAFYFLEHASASARPVAPTGPIAPVLDPWTGPIPASSPTPPAFDLSAIRRDFPILEERVNGRRLVWLDNAATTQKPRQVIERLRHFYSHENSNVHRAAHTLAARSTDAYEAARETVRAFMGASSADEIVFVRGATEAINLVAQSWGRKHLGPDDEIVLTHLEHHANIVPWQQIAAATGAKLRVAPVDDRGQVSLDDYGRLLGPRTKLVSFTQVSNALGTVTPVPAMVAMAKAVGATVLVDGAQAVSHMPVDVRALGADFYVLSGHKVFGPTGIGVLYGTRAALEDMPPWQGGGNMIADVTFEHTRYQPAPQKFEAGTGNIADAVGLGAALEYVMALGMPNIAAYEHQLLEHGTRLLEQIPGLCIVGTAPEKAGVLSFVIEGIRTEDIGPALDREGIAVRAGHHCAQPILRRFGLESTVRASLAFYNTHADLDALAGALHRLTTRRR